MWYSTSDTCQSKHDRLVNILCIHRNMEYVVCFTNQGLLIFKFVWSYMVARRFPYFNRERHQAMSSRETQAKIRRFRI